MVNLYHVENLILLFINVIIQNRVHRVLAILRGEKNGLNV